MHDRQLPRQLLGHLATFVTVAETLNFRHAAEILGRSQPAISAHIKELESYVGVALLVRTTRQVRLTAAGAELLERARRILVDTRRLVGDIQSQAALLKGQVVASFSPTTAFSLTPRVLTTFVRDYPGIGVELREELGPEMLHAVQSGAADIGIGPYRDVPDALSFRPLFEQEFFLIVRSDHALAIRGHARLADLAELDVLCSSIGTTARAVLEEALRSAGIAFNARFEALQYPTLFSLAAANFGAAVMPLVSQDLLRGLDLRAVPFRDARLFRTVGLITRRDEAFSPAVNAFVHVLVETAESEGRQLGLEQSIKRGDA
jgi:LysR family transcriptional regulator, carnitine catabolism transcriptional activator